MSPISQYWLVKTEPECFSIQDLAKAPKQTTCWDGVRNYQARNYLRDQMKKGQQVLFYHSNAEPPAVVGTATVVREGYPDSTAWDKDDQHFDPKASPENPIWQMIDLKLGEIFPRALSLEELRQIKGLEKMELLRKGSRLSVQPVAREEFERIVRLAHEKPHEAPADGASKPKQNAAKKVPKKSPHS